MLTFDKLREITRVCELRPDCSNREGGKLTNCSHQVFGKMKKIVQKSQLSFAYVDSISDDAIAKIFYPNLIKRVRKGKRLPCKERIIETRVKRKGKRRLTWAKLFLEYESVDEKTAYRLTQFKFLARQMILEYQASMKQFYEPGECLFIDYAGLTVSVKENGRVTRLFVFVAVLGFSKRLFAFATRGMTTRDWLLALKKAFNFFGGVTEVVHSDNTVALVKKSGLLPLYTDEAKHFFRFYNCLADTSRVAKSQDNALAENGVSIVTYRILNYMQDMMFTSVDDANAYILREVNKINAAKFQSESFSRDDLFYKSEKGTLADLPKHEYQHIIYQKLLTVPKTYLISYEGHLYSVPHKYIGKRVEIRVYENGVIDILNRHELVTQHHVSKHTSGATIVREHMPIAHQKDAEKTKEFFVAWGHEIGVAAQQMTLKQYDFTRNTRSRHIGKRCIALQKCCNKVGAAVFERACAYALEKQQYHPTYVDMVARARPWEFLAETKPGFKHDNIRGPEYYGGSSHG
ncbi:hypothetical protein N475_25115 [Pseudoalteromonas luteoviolacea DSM 6061]|uniref:Integrase catalytic domain-containing protein n=2 Tax=Pseudoalteromonas luteoviolacea TaxID=43657 RepID=A0A161ZRZ8_9GAMM|nr:hypothetical protein N475_25115 [Pseudoalteromonas luteoviolacea DSM 6061]MBE0388776.1 hypothetical protein [Pseudoalteromonas luteoviolacea DSM 6061]